MTSDLARLSELIRTETGIALSPGQERALRVAVNRAGAGLDQDRFLAAVSGPARGRLLDRLIDEITIQETTFVRDREQLDAISWRALLRTARAGGRDRIRVWSAGCATGEEPYTLALLAAEAFAPVRAPVNVLGTDISRTALDAAASGRYRERAVGALDGALRQRYLERQDDGTYLVGEYLRRLVRFRRHNLAHDPIPPPGESGFDVVVCRNVLIYFGTALAQRLIQSFERSVRPGGLFVIGAADALQRTVARHRANRPPRGTTAAPAARPLRRPLTRPPALSTGQRLATAIDAADKGERGLVLGLVESLLADDPLDSDALYLHGLVTLAGGEPARAVGSLRAALYADASFGLAAFTLGRAYDALGEPAAARRAYERALRLLDPADRRHELLLQQVDIGDVAAACRARLGGRGGPTG